MASCIGLMRKVAALYLVAAMIGFYGQSLSAQDLPDFAVGQEWLIKSIPPGTVKVIIGRIEPCRDKVVVHVSIVDLPAPQEAGALRVSQIAHAPFEKSALAASLDKLIATGVPPAQNFESGYEQWKEHKGGIYTVSIAQALGLSR